MPHECGPLPLVLAALCAAGEVTLTKPGQSATLECGVNVYADRLVWLHGNYLIISIDGKTGFKRKGINRL